MKPILVIIEVIVSALLTISILMQSRGADLSGAITGGSGNGNYYSSKRGVEKILSRTTVVLAFLFIAIGIVYMVI